MCIRDRVGKELTCGRGEWVNAPGADFSVAWFRSNIIGPEHPRYVAPRESDLGSYTDPADPQYGPDPLPFVGPKLVGEGKKYTPTADDVGKLVYCRVTANNNGATQWKTASAPPITAG